MVLFGQARPIGRFGGVNVLNTTYQLIRGRVLQGFSANAIQREMIGLGQGIRRQSVQQIASEVRGLVRSGNVLNRLSPNVRPGRASLVQSRRFFSSQYQYTARVRLFSPFGSEKEDLPVIFNDNRLLTVGEIRERAQAAAERALQASNSYGLNMGNFVVGVNITSAMERSVI